MCGGSELNFTVSFHEYNQRSVAMIPIQGVKISALQSCRIFTVQCEKGVIYLSFPFLFVKKKFSHVFVHKNIFVFTLRFFEAKLTVGKSQ